MRALLRILACTLAATALVAPAPVQALDAGATGCLVSGDVAGTSATMLLSCDGVTTGTLAGTSLAVANWAGDVDGDTGVPATLATYGLADMSGTCTVRRMLGRVWHAECLATDGQRQIRLRWTVTEYRPGRVAGEGAMWQADLAGPPYGAACAFDTIDGLLPGDFDGRYDGLLSGGPVAAPGAQVSIRCSLHSSQANYHTDPALYSVSTGPEPDVAHLRPQPVTVVMADPLDFPVPCTQVTVDGVTWYRADQYGKRYWTLDPHSRCVQVTAEGYSSPAEQVAWHALLLVLDEVC